MTAPDVSATPAPRPGAAPALLPRHVRFDEIAAQVLTRQERDRQQQPDSKPA